MWRISSANLSQSAGKKSRCEICAMPDGRRSGLMIMSENSTVQDDAAVARCRKDVLVPR